MLDYKTISEAYGLAEKTTAKKAAEPDEMDIAGVPSVKGGAADKDEGIFSKFLRNISKSREKLSKNLEKSKENLSKNVKKSEENLKKHLGMPKQKLNKNLGPGDHSEGEVNKNAFKDLSLGKPTKYNVKEDLNLPKSSATLKKGVSMTDLHHKSEGNPYSMTGSHHQNGEHEEDAKSHLQKLLSQASKAAEQHPLAAGIAAGATGALAAGAGALRVKKLLNRKKKPA